MFILYLFIFMAMVIDIKWFYKGVAVLKLIFLYVHACQVASLGHNALIGICSVR